MTGRRLKLALLGATGGTGREVLEQALAAGHEVIAVVRDPARVTTTHERLRVVRAELTEPTTFAAALAGVDAVISAVGPRSLPRAPISIYSAAAKATLSAMKQAGVTRVIAVTSAGYLRTDRYGWFARNVVTPILRRVLRHIYDDMQRAEGIYEASDAQWTVVRPPRLVDGPRTGRYRFSVEDAVEGASSITRADLADVLLGLAVDGAHAREHLAVSS